MAFGIIIGLFVGFIITVVLGPKHRRRKETWASFRPLGHGSTSSPYRDQGAAEELTPTLAEVRAAVRRAGLQVRERSNGFDLRAGGRVLTVRTRDPERVTLASLEIVDQATETLVFALALALVALYGPIVVTEAMFGRFVVDGSCDAASLREQRAERIRSMAKAIISDLDDMSQALSVREELS
jgi:hypothetical protein